MPEKIPKHLPHILIQNTARSELYTYPFKVRGKSIQLPPRQRQIHGQNLLHQFDQVRQESENLISEQKTYGIDAGNGIYIQFESEPGFDLKFESLEARQSGIELMAVQQIDNKTFAIVFVPEGKLHILTNKVSDYLEKLTKTEKYKNKELVESISEIHRAVVNELWTDDRKIFPKDDQQKIWWEVWLRAGDDPQSVLDFFKLHAQQLGLTVEPETIPFPDRTVITVFGSSAQISRSVNLLNCIAELRMAKDTADFFTKMDSVEQLKWIKELLSITIPPPAKCPVICILDTGTNNEHPLLKSYLALENMHVYDPVWNVFDRNGHGTEMAGLALYGDLAEALAQTGFIEMSHQLESVKIFPHHIKNPPHLYGNVTAEGIARAEIQNPDRKRIICMAVCATDDRDRGRPSSWSACLDKICAGADDETQRLIIIAAGNTPPEDCHHYPYHAMSDLGIHDPGQAWNSITVGAYTDKAHLDLDEYPGWKLVAPQGDLSPSSSTSLTWQRPWPIKPDIVMEGGNMAINPSDGKADYVDTLGLLSSSHHHAIGKPLVITRDTSAATALASRMAARIQAAYPDYWPETIRALMIHSAQWTEAMRDRFNPKNKKQL